MQGSKLKKKIEEIIIKIGKYLYKYQVITEDIKFYIEDKNTITLKFEFIRKNPGPFTLQIKRSKNELYLRSSEKFKWWGPLKKDSFIRIVPNGKINEPSGGQGGITFYFTGINEKGRFELKAHDRGGIWEEFLNMEAFLYEPQVAGTYYADAYSAYIFGWMAEKTSDDKYLEAASMALDFIMRTYPEYKPMRLDAFGHTDFKNPAFIETVEEFMIDKVRKEDLEKWRSFYKKMINTEGYSPINVFALRYFWWSVRNKYFKDPTEEFKQKPLEYIKKIKNNITKDGLIQDNFYSKDFFGGYYDSYDITYHIYALSWLCRGYDYLPLKEVWKMITDGAKFSIALTTPGGECSYIGRSANNIYHPISAIYSFLYVAKNEKRLSNTYYRGVKLIFNYIKKYQFPEGNFPTALNFYPDKLIGWSHCQTPYNATTGYFLIRALPLIPSKMKENALLLEKNGKVDFHQSRYGAISNKNIYFVIFAGSDISPYPHSGVHNTGVAGLAVLGLQGKPSILPILEQSLMEEQWSTSDLPDIVSQDGEIVVPIGRGLLNFESDDNIIITLEYGNFKVVQSYMLKKNGLLIATRLTCFKSGVYSLMGAPGLSFRVDYGYKFKIRNKNLIYITPYGNLTLEIIETPLSDGTWKIIDKSSTGRGFHQKVGWYVKKEFKQGEKITYLTRLILKKPRLRLVQKKAIPSKEPRRFKIPNFILKKIYKKNSLKNTKEGISFMIKNPIASVTITAFDLLKINDKIYSESIKIIINENEILMQEITEENPLKFNKGNEATILIEGEKLISKKYDITLGITTKDIGPLIIKVSDTLSS